MLKAARRPETMLQEIQAAEEWIEGFFADWDSRMERYKGPAWRPGGVKHERAGDTDESFDPENFAQDWVRFYSAHLVLGNPRARFTTSRSGDERTIVKAHELAENRWIRETKMRDLNEKLAVDFGHHRAICLVLPSLDPVDSDKDDMKGWPSAKRISPRRSYVYDTSTIDKEEERWRGHKSIHQRHELLERARENPDEGWDEEEIQALAEEYRVEEVRGGERGRGSAPRRDEIVLYNIWMRDYEPTKADLAFHGKQAWNRQLRHGAWLTLGVMKGGKRGRWVRRPFPYWGDPGGPYVVIDGYYIPDEACGLAQIPALDAEVQELNLHARAESRAMAKFKNGILCDGSDPEFMDKIQMFEDQFVVGIDGMGEDIRKKVLPVQFGGTTDLHRLHTQVLRDRVNRRGGITDAQRGETQAGITATADQIAEQASQTQVGFIASKFIAGIREILHRVSIYLAFGDSKTRLGPEARRSLKNPDTGAPAEDVVYEGGISTKEEADWFFSLGIEIEPYSMGQTSEALEQQRILQMMNLLAVLLPMMAQFPFVLWDDLIETLGEMLNIPNLADYFDPQALQQFQQLAMQGQQIQAQQGAGKPQPRLAQDVSRLQGGRAAMPMQGNMLGALLAATQRAKVGMNGAA